MTEGMKILDHTEDEHGALEETLYRLDNDICDDWRVLVVVSLDGEELTYLLDDEQSSYKPDTIDECSEYGWYNVEDINEVHG